MIEKKHRLSQDNVAEQLTGVILLYGTLGKLLNHILEPEEITMLTQEDLFSELPFGEDQPESINGLKLLQQWSEKVKKEFSDEDFDELRADYTRLFIGPGNVLAPPWESVYESDERLVFQEQTIKVRGWYRRFGLEAEKIYNEPDDHIGLELAFIAYLAGFALQALQSQDEENLNMFLDAMHQFLGEHPLKWAHLWRDLVMNHAQTPFYKGLALLTLGSLKALDSIFVERKSTETL